MFRSKTNQNIYIGLGSNLGDRAGNLLLAVRGILNAGLEMSRCSAIYETEPVGEDPQPPFLNMVVEVSGTSAPAADKLLARLLRVEYALGRIRSARMGPRTIDLDLLLYKNETSDTEFLTLPHPRLHQRRFVLVPLAEIAPHLVHPVLKKNMSTLLAETQDRSSVSLWKP
ncbi:MAG TPA: 2-amino-4-hydroxy-6-hydroxymethyldihydropteridine diphosphokinase [Pyrinomonadaceae bacterium]